MFLEKRSSLNRQTNKKFNIIVKELRLNRLNERNRISAFLKSDYPLYVIFIFTMLSVFFPLFNVRVFDIIPLSISLESNIFLTRLSHTLVILTIIFTLIGIALSTLARKDRIVFRVLSEESFMNIAIYSIYLTCMYNLSLAMFIESIPKFYLHRMVIASTSLFVFTLSISVICFYKIFSVLRLDNYYRYVSRILHYECYKSFLKQLKETISENLINDFLIENKLRSSNLLYHYKMNNITFKDLESLDDIKSYRKSFELKDINLIKLHRFIKKEFINKGKKIDVNTLVLGEQNYNQTILWVEDNLENKIIQKSLKKIYRHKTMRLSTNSKNLTPDYILFELSQSVKNHETQVVKMILDIFHSLYSAYNPAILNLKFMGINSDIEILQEFEMRFYNIVILSFNSLSYDLQTIFKWFLYHTSYLNFITNNDHSFARFLNYYGYIGSQLLKKNTYRDIDLDYFFEIYKSYIANYRFLIQSISSKFKDFNEKTKESNYKTYSYLFNVLTDLCLQCINENSSDLIQITINELCQSNPHHFFENDEVKDEISTERSKPNRNCERIEELKIKLIKHKRPMLIWFYSIKALQYWASLLFSQNKVSIETFKCVFQSCSGSLRYQYDFNMYDIYLMDKESHNEEFSWTLWDYEKRLTGVTYTPPSADLWIKFGAIYEIIINGHYNPSYEEEMLESDIIPYYTFLEFIFRAIKNKKVDLYYLEKFLECSRQAVLLHIEAAEHILYRDIEQFKKKYYVKIVKHIIKMTV